MTDTTFQLVALVVLLLSATGIIGMLMVINRKLGSLCEKVTGTEEDVKDHEKRIRTNERQLAELRFGSRGRSSP